MAHQCQKIVSVLLNDKFYINSIIKQYIPHVIYSGSHKKTGTLDHSEITDDILKIGKILPPVTDFAKTTKAMLDICSKLWFIYCCC